MLTMLRRSATVLFLALLGVSTNAISQGKPISLTLGWQPTMNGARYFVAEADKLFEKEGLKVNLVKFTAGPPFFAAFQSGSIDIGFVGLQPAVTAIGQGIEVKVVAIENEAGGAEGLVARKDSGIRNLQDLRGKAVATKRGSSAHTALLKGLEAAKLKQSDIRLIDLDVTALIPAFNKGDIQAAWYWEPWMGLLKREGGNVIATDRDINVPVGILWLAREKWLQSNGEAMQRFLRILDRAARQIHEKPEATAALVAKGLALKDEHVLEVFTKGASWPTNAQSLAPGYIFSMDPKVVSSGKGIAGAMTDNANFQKSVGILQNVPDYKKAVDSSHLTKYVKK